MTYETHFKAYRNMLTKVIRAAKQNFYLNKLNIEADNSKKMWRTTDIILGRKKHKLPSSFVYNNTTINDPQVVAETFKNHFTSIGNSPAMNSRDIRSSYVDYLPPPVPFSFFLRPTTISGVNSIINGIKGSSAG